MRILLLALICLFTYFATFQSEFKLDDFNFIDPALGRQYSSIVELFTQSPNLHYNPLNNLFNETFFHTFGNQVAHFHILNLFLFFLNSLLLYRIATVMTKSNQVALLAAVLFCLHPVNAEIVNQIVFNTVLIAALLFQLSLIVFDRFINTKNWWDLIGALFLAFVSALTLETSLILPMYLLFWSYFVRGKNFRTAVTLTLPFWILSLIMLGIWFLISSGNSLVDGIMPKVAYLELSPLNFSGTLIALIGWYLQKLLIPVGHVWIYSLAPLSPVSSVLHVSTVLLIAVLVFVLRRKILSSPVVTMGTVWFIAGFLFLVPGSFAHPAAGLVIEPYWFYISSMGFFILAAMLFVSFGTRIGHIPTVIIMALICGTLFFYTQRFNVIAKTQKSYSEYWLGISMNSTPLTALARSAYLDKNYVLAAHYYELYLKHFAHSPYCKDSPDIVYTTLGAIYLDMGDFVKSQEMTLQAIKINPFNPKSYIVDGMRSVKEKDYFAAEDSFVKAIAVDSQNILSRYNLVDLYVNTQQYQKAIVVLDQLTLMNVPMQDRNKILIKLARIRSLEAAANQ